MSDVADNIPAMPERSQRVREALLRFETSTTRPSSLLALSDEHLYKIGLLLSDRELSISEAWRRANDFLDADEGGAEVLARSTFYRFAECFKALLGRVTAEYQGMVLESQKSLETQKKIDVLCKQNEALLAKVQRLEEALCDK